MMAPQARAYRHFNSGLRFGVFCHHYDQFTLQRKCYVFEDVESVEYEFLKIRPSMRLPLHDPAKTNCACCIQNGYKYATTFHPVPDCCCRIRAKDHQMRITPPPNLHCRILHKVRTCSHPLMKSASFEFTVCSYQHISHVFYRVARCVIFLTLLRLMTS